jgi:hypothetical protein
MAYVAAPAALPGLQYRGGLSKMLRLAATKHRGKTLGPFVLLGQLGSAAARQRWALPLVPGPRFASASDLIRPVHPRRGIVQSRGPAATTTGLIFSPILSGQRSKIRVSMLSGLIVVI